MKAHRSEFRVRAMAKLFEVSRSGFYKSLKAERAKPEKYDGQIISLIKKTWEKSRKTYGAVRLMKEVKKTDVSYGMRRVRKMMKSLKIKGRQDVKFRVRTTDSRHGEKTAPDLVKRNFSPERKNEIWVSDVTYLKKAEGWLYLCVITDLFSRKAVSWKVSERNDAELIVDAVRKGLDSRNPGRGMIFHSDRGSNYCSKEVRDLLKNNGIRKSCSRKGNCWDNAVSESFFGSLKRELECNVFYDLEDAEKELGDHIDVFYNEFRMHSSIGYVSPNEYERAAEKMVSTKT